MNQRRASLLGVAQLVLVVLAYSLMEAHSEEVAMARSQKALDRLAVELETKSDQLSADEKVLLFMADYHGANHDKAIAAFEQLSIASEADPGTAMRLKMAYAESLLAAGRHEHGRAVLESLNKSTPDNPRVLCLLGIAHVRAGTLKEGMDYLRRAAKLGYAPAHYELATLIAAPKERIFHYLQVLILAEQGAAVAEKAAQAVLVERSKVKE